MQAQIEHRIRSAADDGSLRGLKHLHVDDLSDGCGAKVEITIVADEFENKPLLQCHRLVHSILQEERKTIHALTLKTIPTSKWTGEADASA
jgi:stress-induced morphogen